MATEVRLEKRFAAYQMELEGAVKRALDQAGNLAIGAVREVPTDYRIGTILESVMRTGVEHTTKGKGVWIVAQDWRSIFFEWGTYRRRRKALKQPRRSDRPNRGVKPVHFLLKACDAARARLPGLLASEMERIRV